MNNPNPFVPKGSLLAQQSLRRSRLKITVACVLGVSVTSLLVMLFQGCERKQPVADNNPPPVDTNPAVASSAPSGPDISSNPVASAPTSNPVAAAPPGIATVVPPPAPIIPPAPPAPATPPTPDVSAGSTYEVAAGDTLAKIAKKNGVTLKALEAANPGVDPKKLKVKQKLNLPGEASPAASASASPASTPDGGGETYTIKSGDTLSKIAKRHGVSLRAIRAANPKLNTDHIKVGDKLILPAKTETAAPAAPASDNPATAAPTAPAPVAPTAAPPTTPSGPGH
jgi:LysM repeat protein